MTDNNTDQKNYTLIRRNIQRYILKVKNFNISASMRGNLRIPSIDFIPSILSSKIRLILEDDLSIGIIDFIGEMKQIINLPSTMSLGLLDMVGAMKLKTRLIGEINTTIALTGITKQKVQMFGSMSMGILGFSGTAIAAQFNPLSDFDGMTLADLDGLTLAQMDYT